MVAPHKRWFEQINSPSWYKSYFVPPEADSKWSNFVPYLEVTNTPLKGSRELTILKSHVRRITRPPGFTHTSVILWTESHVETPKRNYTVHWDGGTGPRRDGALEAGAFKRKVSWVLVWWKKKLLVCFLVNLSIGSIGVVYLAKNYIYVYIYTYMWLMFMVKCIYQSQQSLYTSHCTFQLKLISMFHPQMKQLVVFFAYCWPKFWRAFGWAWGMPLVW